MVTQADSGAGRARPRYSVVIPVYRSASVLPALVERLDAFFAQHPWSREVIFVNDGSPDESWEVLEQIKEGRDDIVELQSCRSYRWEGCLCVNLPMGRLPQRCLIFFT